MKNVLSLVIFLIAPISVWAADAGNVKSSAMTVDVPSKSLEDQDYYFATGSDHGRDRLMYSNEVKFYIGITYRIFTLKDLVKFKIQYNQTSFWNLWDDGISNPFFDNTYNINVPQLVFDQSTWLRDLPWKVNNIPVVDSLAVTLFAHESNGDLGRFDRSWDRWGVLSLGLFNRETVGFGLFATSWPFYWLQPPESRSVYNQDIASYRGLGGIELDISPKLFKTLGVIGTYTPIEFKDLGIKLSSNVAIPTAQQPAVFTNLQVETFFNLRVFRECFRSMFGVNSFTDWSPVIYCQYFYGYAEDLLEYNVIRCSFRVGFAFSDLPDL